ncbi:MAG: UPF0182 family protein [Actinobacteria bacterium]|nr:UPF0182 family protein [Actinomycetota bacterium]
MRRSEGTPESRRPGSTFEAHRRRRITALIALVALVVVVASLRGLASFFIDYLWFAAQHRTGVWGAVLGAKVVLAALFIAVAFVIVFVNLWLADRTAGEYSLLTNEDPVVLRFHEVFGHRRRSLRVLFALVLALIMGGGAASQWKDWILFTHAVPFGRTDATFGRDIGFYVFRLPFIEFLVSWLFATLVLALLATLVADYFNGGILVQGPPGMHLSDRAAQRVKVHASVLLALLALVKTADYWFARFGLVFSTRGTVDGALFTDSKIELKAINLLLVISIFACVLFVVNIWRRGWRLPIMAVGLWAVVSILGAVAVPALVQRFSVQPAEESKERPYLVHNIAATRAAFGIDDVHVTAFANSGNLDAQTLNANTVTVQNVRLWDPAVMNEVFTKLQGIRSFYRVPEPDIDRYRIDGRLTQVLTAGRDIDASSLPQNSWVARTLSYTHGYGNIMAPTNASDSGQPVFTNKDIPVVSKGTGTEVTQPATYFGEGLSGYVIANSRTREIYYIDAAGKTKFSRYTGSGGIRLGSGVGGFLRRAAVAMRFADINPLISSNIDRNSKLLMYRDVRERVHTLAPFLDFDDDPYMVVRSDGRLQYIIDAYTTTSNYPNSQRAITSDLSPTSGLNRRFNYVRNSVKAVVDAYDGTVTLYEVDPSDPIVRAYAKAFPGLFTPKSKIPADLAAHFRYPEDLFKVQTRMYGRYHLTDPSAFYTQENAWDVSADPNKAGISTGSVPGAVDANGNPIGAGAVPMDPYYLLMRLPGSTEESFLILRPFVPKQAGAPNKQVLTGFMTAQSDPNDYGRLDLFQLPANNLPSGPYNVAAQMMQDRKVSSIQTLLCNAGSSGGGSECEYGNLLVIPIDQSLLYVRPWYVKSSGNSLPELQQVIVAYEDAGGNLQVAVEPTFHGAMVDLFGANVPATAERNAAKQVDLSVANPNGTSGTNGKGSSSGSSSGASSTTSSTSTTAPSTTLPVPSGSQADLIRRLNAAFAQADAALKSGDFTGYAEAIGQAKQLAAELQAMSNASTPGTSAGTSAPATSAPAAPTTTTP